MPGVGTRMAPTKDNTRPVCLNLTRLISRVGRGPMTGIDRVELAYLRYFTNGPHPFYGLIKCSDGIALLDAKGMSALLSRFEGKVEWGPKDTRSRLHFRQAAAMRAAVSDLRRLAVKWSRPSALNRHLSEIFSCGVTYFDVGHSKFDPSVAGAFSALPGARLIFMLHDVIPLDFPQYQRPESTSSCKLRIGHVGTVANHVLYPSNQARVTTELHLARFGRVPPSLVVPLGLDTVVQRRAELPEGLNLSLPYFVTIGTIEPRKNHTLLLDLWDKLALRRKMPTLFIVGNRGWQNAEVFKRLDAKPAGVIELNNLSDGAMAALLQGATALLFPSHAEGFGLPPVEAAAAEVPVLCSDLPVLREVLGSYPTYLSPTNLDAWEGAVLKMVRCAKEIRRTNLPADERILLPNWDNHFKIVSKLL